MTEIDKQRQLAVTIANQASQIDELLPWGYRDRSCAPKTSVGT